MRATAFCTIASPIPVPGYLDCEWSRSNTLKIRSWCSGAMPIPLSLTQTLKLCPLSSAMTRMEGRTPGATNFMAFPSRLAMTWVSRVGLATTRDKGASTCTSAPRSEEHTSELQSHVNLVCRLLLEKKKYFINILERMSDDRREFKHDEEPTGLMDAADDGDNETPFAHLTPLISSTSARRLRHLQSY